jgi:hypothetical protein
MKPYVQEVVQTTVPLLWNFGQLLKLSALIFFSSREFQEFSLLGIFKKNHCGVGG